MTALSLLLLASTLVLRSGDRIAVEAPPRTENGVVIFRSGGQLYSLAAAEIDAEATRAAASEVEKKDDAVRRLRVSEDERRRLLAELERNHGGTPMPEPQASSLKPEPAPTRAETIAGTREEWEWRRLARGHEEAVRQAQEEITLLEEEVDRLRGEIRFFVFQGFKPHQFTWQTTRLAYAIENLPRAELNLRRVQRGYDQFRDDARRQGVMPGWLR